MEPAEQDEHCDHVGNKEVIMEGREVAVGCKVDQGIGNRVDELDLQRQEGHLILDS